MDICEDCHEKDRNFIKCDKPIRKHLNMSNYYDQYACNILDKYEMCGKIVAVLYNCSKYEDLPVYGV